MMHYNSGRLKWQMVILLLLGLYSCKKNNVISSGPYQDGPSPLVSFADKLPSPSKGKAGDKVTFYVSGLSTVSQGFIFYIGGDSAHVVSYTDSTVTVVVPTFATSGAGSVVTTGKYYAGPIFTINGNVALDKTFQSGTGANGDILDVQNRSDGNYYIVGNFTDYDGRAASSPVNRIALISSDGAFVTSNGLKAGKGASGTINSLAVMSTGAMMIGGSFNSYNVRTGIYNVTRLNANGSLDSVFVPLLNMDSIAHPEWSIDTVPSFNGGFFNGRGGVVKVFGTSGNNVIIIGNYAMYGSYYYERSTVTGLLQDKIAMNQFAKVSSYGVLDSSYNFNRQTNKSYAGTNGFIRDAIQLSDGNIIVVGSFTTINGVTVNRITRLTNDGLPDVIFASASGGGADGEITRITYNATTHRIMIIGTFTHYGGKAAPGIAMLYEDGSIDPGFVFGSVNDGAIVNYAGQLANGKVIVSGTFQKYNGITRKGILILNSDGSISLGDNNTGAFIGKVNAIRESVTTLGTPAVILFGSISMFDNQTVNNILRISLK